MSSPFHTYAGLLERSTHLVHMYIHNDPMVIGYQFWGHRTVDDAYGNPLNSGVGGAGPLALFQVPRGQSFRSETLRRKRLGLVDESRRGTTHALFDVDDFIVPAAGGASIPEDGGWLFLRLQENRVAAGLLANLGVPEATITFVAVVATDRITIGGLIFEFAAGANALGGTVGTGGNPFIVGLGASDSAAAANLVLALNDVDDVEAAYDLAAPLDLHTFAPAAVGASVTVQPEDGTPVLVPGSIGAYTITTDDAPRIVIDAASLAAGALVAASDIANPVLGPIYCVPPAIFFGTYEPTFSLQGIAPSGTASVAGAIPDLDEDITLAAPRAMYLVFPKPLTALSIRNLSAVNLLVAFGPGQLMLNVPAGGELPLYSGATKGVLLACPDGVDGAVFSLHGAVAGA